MKLYIEEVSLWLQLLESTKLCLLSLVTTFYVVQIFKSKIYFFSIQFHVYNEVFTYFKKRK